MKPMYKGIAFSPITILTQSINALDTVIHIESVDGFPTAPNSATIDDKETIRYAQIGEGILSGCTRGVEGEAVSHTAGCKVARTFTAEDYNNLVDNVADTYTAVTEGITAETAARIQGDTDTLASANEYTDEAAAAKGDSLSYADNLLQLTSNGAKIGTPVTIATGGGGGSAYDKVITTQAEFDELLASSTWFGANSVCFVGNGGTLKFTREQNGILIPPNVETIHGKNVATIEINNYVYQSGVSRMALGYAALPASSAATIKNINLIATSKTYLYGFDKIPVVENCSATLTGAGSVVGFQNCTRTTDCVATLNSKIGNGGATLGFASISYAQRCKAIAVTTGFNTGSGAGTSIGFDSCNNLDSCRAEPTTTLNAVDTSMGFKNCNYLVNCSCQATTNAGGNSLSNGAENCVRLTNCAFFATVKHGVGTAFYNCVQLTNCTGKGTVISGGAGKGYCYFGCSYLNSCNGQATTAFTRGTNTEMDTATVVAG